MAAVPWRIIVCGADHFPHSVTRYVHRKLICLLEHSCEYSTVAADPEVHSPPGGSLPAWHGDELGRHAGGPWQQQQADQQQSAC